MTEIFEKLAAANIQLLPSLEISTHFLLERDGFVALVERRGAAFGPVGAAGLLSGKGLAPLVWRNGDPWFVARGFEETATAEQVVRLRLFQSDLRAALA